MLDELARWLPEHDARLVADGAYAPLARRPPARVTLVSRLRADAALYELPAPRKPGERGRPRLKGARLPKPSELAKTTPAHEWRLVETCERGRIRQRLPYARQGLWASVSRKPILPVISRDPTEEEADDFFFSSDVVTSPALAVGDFADRKPNRITIIISPVITNKKHPCHPNRHLPKAIVKKTRRLKCLRKCSPTSSVGWPTTLPKSSPHGLHSRKRSGRGSWQW
jgi:hypothetical protein